MKASIENHPQFQNASDHRLPRRGGDGGGGSVGGSGGTFGIGIFFPPAPGSVEHFLVSEGDFALCWRKRVESLAAYELLLTVVSLVSLAIAPVRAAEDDAALLTTLGYTTGQSVLLTHMAIETLADAFAGKAYKAEQATTYVTTYINITKGMKEQMKNSSMPRP